MRALHESGLALFVGAAKSATTSYVGVSDPGALLDAQFFDEDPARPLQLRPRLEADRAPYDRKAFKGEMVLASRGLYPRLNCFVRPPRSLRSNTPAAVEWCVAWLERERPSLGPVFRQIQQGQVPNGFVRQ